VNDSIHCTIAIPIVGSIIFLGQVPQNFKMADANSAACVASSMPYRGISFPV
jgi:hypothetical protein